MSAKALAADAASWIHADLVANSAVRIRFEQRNPKREGTASHQRYEAYKSAATVDEFLRLCEGNTRSVIMDWRHDLQRGFVAVLGPGRPQSKDDSEEARRPQKRRERREEAGDAPPQKRERVEAPAAAAAPAAEGRGGGGGAEGEDEDPAAFWANLETDISAVFLEPPTGDEAPLSSLVTAPAASAPAASAPAASASASVASGALAGGSGRSLGRAARGVRRVADQRLQGGSSSSSSSSSPRRRRAGAPAQRPMQEGPPQLVRDVVQDYVEGRGDPDITDQSVRRTASGITGDEPITKGNRSRYIWVVECASGAYTHDPDAAVPVDQRLIEGSRCDVCGSRCAMERSFRVRCYPRRSSDQPTAPRYMRREIYRAGIRCVQGLLGIPPLPSRSVAQLREKIQASLRARDFAPQAWCEPLHRLARGEGVAYRDVLHGELARVIRECSSSAVSWRRLAAEAQAPEDLRWREVSVRTRPTLQVRELRPVEDEEAPGDFASAPPPPPHELVGKGRKRPPFVIVVPSYNCPERLRDCTLAWLRRQRMAQAKIEVWVAPGAAQREGDRLRYRRALGKEWASLKIREGVDGSIMEQRWHIAGCHPEGTHLVYMDDDVVDVFAKVAFGGDAEALRPLPPGGLEALIQHAGDLAEQEGVSHWGVSPSTVPADMAADRISRRCGLLSSALYGALVPPGGVKLRSIYSSPTDDLERSCRAFKRDGAVLRYLMYCARTTCQAEDGPQMLYASETERSVAEEQSALDLAEEFGDLLAVTGGVKSAGGEESIVACSFRPHGRPALAGNGSPAVSEEMPLSALAAPTAAAASRRDRQRQVTKAREERTVLRRAAALQDALEQATAGRDRGQWQERRPAKAAGGAPEALDGILKLATQGRQTLQTLDLAPVAVGRALDFDCATQLLRGILPTPAEAAPAPLAEPPPTPPSWDQGAVEVGGLAAMTPILPPFGIRPQILPLPPAAWPPAAPKASVTCAFSEFSREELNTTYTLDRVTVIQGRHSFWDKSRTRFVYWQQKLGRWAIAQRWDKDKDLLERVRGGAEVGWAFQKAATTWSEFRGGAWRDVATAPQPALQAPPDAHGAQSAHGAFGAKTAPLPPALGQADIADADADAPTRLRAHLESARQQATDGALAAAAAAASAQRSLHPHGEARPKPQLHPQSALLPEPPLPPQPPPQPPQPPQPPPSSLHPLPSQPPQPRPQPPPQPPTTQPPPQLPPPPPPPPSVHPPPSLHPQPPQLHPQPQLHPWAPQGDGEAARRQPLRSPPRPPRWSAEGSAWPPADD